MQRPEQSIAMRSLLVRWLGVAASVCSTCVASRKERRANSRFDSGSRNLSSQQHNSNTQLTKRAMTAYSAECLVSAKPHHDTAAATAAAVTATPINTPSVPIDSSVQPPHSNSNSNNDSSINTTTQSDCAFTLDNSSLSGSPVPTGYIHHPSPAHQHELPQVEILSNSQCIIRGEFSSLLPELSIDDPVLPLGFTLPAECPTGPTEYKWKLCHKSKQRIQHLTTQMLWRLHESIAHQSQHAAMHLNCSAVHDSERNNSNSSGIDHAAVSQRRLPAGQCRYMIGVLDSGSCIGCRHDEMIESLALLHSMACELQLHCTVNRRVRTQHGMEVAEVIVSRLVSSDEVDSESELNNAKQHKSLHVSASSPSIKRRSSNSNTHQQQQQQQRSIVPLSSLLSVSPILRSHQIHSADSLFGHVNGNSNNHNNNNNSSARSDDNDVSQWRMRSESDAASYYGTDAIIPERLCVSAAQLAARQAFSVERSLLDNQSNATASVAPATSANSAARIERYFATEPEPESLRTHEQQLKAFLACQSRHARIALVCSGGTRVALERNTVRYIDNFSTGQRGALCSEHLLLQHGYAVILLHRRGSALPFVRRLGTVQDVASQFDLSTLATATDDTTLHLKASQQTRDAMRHSHALQRDSRLLLLPYDSLSDYLHKLRMICDALRDTSSSAALHGSTNGHGSGGRRCATAAAAHRHSERAHKHSEHSRRNAELRMHQRLSHVLFFAAAAVSDYYVPFDEQSQHKLVSRERNAASATTTTATSSNSTDDSENVMQLTLRHTPKMLRTQCQEWLCGRAFSCAFKLQTDESKLLPSCLASARENECSCVVGNLLHTRYDELRVLDTRRQELLHIRRRSPAELAQLQQQQLDDESMQPLLDGLESEVDDLQLTEQLQSSSSSSSSDEALSSSQSGDSISDSAQPSSAQTRNNDTASPVDDTEPPDIDGTLVELLVQMHSQHIQHTRTTLAAQGVTSQRPQ